MFTPSLSDYNILRIFIVIFDLYVFHAYLSDGRKMEFFAKICKIDTLAPPHTIQTNTIESLPLPLPFLLPFIYLFIFPIIHSPFIFLSSFHTFIYPSFLIFTPLPLPFLLPFMYLFILIFTPPSSSFPPSIHLSIHPS